METQVCIIGAGPAGLISAIFAAKAGAQTVVIEKNAAAGRKLLLTGGGRCNLTHTGSIEDFVRAYGPPRLARESGEAGKMGRFLRHSLYEFSPVATRVFFDEIGITTVADDESCVFPISESANDVREALVRKCQELGVTFIFGPPSAQPMSRPRPSLRDEAGRGVEGIEKSSNEFAVSTGEVVLTAQKLIIATGGKSYPATGSTGDGYKLAKSLGHTIIEPRPALVPLEANEQWCYELAGTSLDYVKILAKIEGRKVIVTGPLVFTQDGIGGPAVLDLSWYLADYLPAEKPIGIAIDIIPSMNESQLDEYLLGQLSQYSKKIIVNVLFDLVPKKLAGCLCRLAGIAGTTGNQLKKEQRRQIIQLLKKLPLSIKATRPIDEATITRGGVATNEIDPKTMQSKICPGLFFAGEVIDIDGPCGGYNLQICWSTGALAGKIQAERF